MYGVPPPIRGPGLHIPQSVLSGPPTLGSLDIPRLLAIIHQRKLPILRFPLPILDFDNHLHLAFRHDLIKFLQLPKVFQNFDAILVQWSGFGFESV